MHGMLESMVQGKTKKHLNIERIAQIKSAVGSFSLCTAGREQTINTFYVRLLLESTSSISILDFGSLGAGPWKAV